MAARGELLERRLGLGLERALEDGKAHEVEPRLGVVARERAQLRSLEARRQRAARERDHARALRGEAAVGLVVVWRHRGEARAHDLGRALEHDRVARRRRRSRGVLDADDRRHALERRAEVEARDDRRLDLAVGRDGGVAAQRPAARVEGGRLERVADERAVDLDERVAAREDLGDGGRQQRGVAHERVGAGERRRRGGRRQAGAAVAPAAAAAAAARLAPSAAAAAAACCPAAAAAAAVHPCRRRRRLGARALRRERRARARRRRDALEQQVVRRERAGLVEAADLDAPRERDPERLRAEHAALDERDERRVDGDRQLHRQLGRDDARDDHDAVEQQLEAVALGVLFL